MRGKFIRILAAIILVGAAGAGGYLWLQGRSDQALQLAVERLKSHLPAGMKLDIATTSMHPASRAAEFDHVTFTDDNRPDRHVTVGRFVISGLAPSGDGGASASEATLEDVVLSAGDTKLAMATLTLNGLSAPAAGPDGSVPIRSVRIAGGTIDHAVISKQDVGGGQDVTLSHVTIGALADGKLDRITFADFNATVPGEAGTTGQLRLKELTLLAFDIAALADGSFRTKAAFGGLHLADFDLAGDNGDFSFAALDMSVPSRGPDERPTSVRLTLDGARLEPRPGPKTEMLMQVLARLKRTDVVLSLTCDGTEDYAAHAGTANETLVLDGMGDLKLDLAMGNLPDSWQLDQLDDQAKIQAVAAMTLGPARLGWTDRGLVPAIEQETGGGMNPDQIGQLGESVLRQQLAALGLGAVTPAWPGQVALFLRKPGHIEFRLDPGQGVSFAGLMDGGQPIVAKFGLLKPTLAVDAGP